MHRLLITDTTNTVQTIVQSQNTNARLGTLSNHDLRLVTNSTDRVAIDANGRFGIGTMTPVATEAATRLTVFATDNSEHIGLNVENAGTGQTALIIQRTGGTAARWYEYIPSGSGTLTFHNGAARFSISSGGVINIPNLTASSDVQTDGSKNLISTSDERLKTARGVIENATDMLNQLKPRYFDWKDPAAHNGYRQLGFYAQEVYPILPEAAPYDRINDQWGFNSRAMVAVLTKGFQEHDSRIDSLEDIIAVQHEDRITYLERKNVDLRHKVTELELRLQPAA